MNQGEKPYDLVLQDTNDLHPAETQILESLLGETVELSRIFTSIVRKRETAGDQGHQV